MKASPALFTQYSALSDVNLKGCGLFADSTVATVCSLMAVTAIDSTYSDIHRGVLTQGELWESGVKSCSSNEDIIDIYWIPGC